MVMMLDVDRGNYAQQQQQQQQQLNLPTKTIFIMCQHPVTVTLQQTMQ